VPNRCEPSFLAGSQQTALFTARVGVASVPSNDPVCDLSITHSDGQKSVMGSVALSVALSRFARPEVATKVNQQDRLRTEHNRSRAKRRDNTQWLGAGQREFVGPGVINRAFVRIRGLIAIQAVTGLAFAAGSDDSEASVKRRFPLMACNVVENNNRTASRG
jgi:hypothetical protein